MYVSVLFIYVFIYLLIYLFTYLTIYSTYFLYGLYRLKASELLTWIDLGPTTCRPDVSAIRLFCVF